MKNEDLQGWVYVMSNQSMPDILKIGVTKRTVEERRRNLSSSTGVPIPFDIEYECEVEDCYRVEKAIKTIFAPYRINPKKEFYKVSVTQVIALLQLVGIRNTTELIAAELPESKRNPRFKFNVMNIPIGAELKFVKDEDITVCVVDDNKVVMDNKKYSLSKLTKELMGYIVRPLQFWEYDGMNLLDIYRATYGK